MEQTINSCGSEKMKNLKADILFFATWEGGRWESGTHLGMYEYGLDSDHDVNRASFVQSGTGGRASVVASPVEPSHSAKISPSSSNRTCISTSENFFQTPRSGNDITARLEAASARPYLAVGAEYRRPAHSSREPKMIP